MTELPVWDKDSPYRKIVSLLANITIIVLIVYVITDFEGFKHAYECKAYLPYVEALKACSNGIRADFCAPLPLSNFTVVTSGFK